MYRNTYAHIDNNILTDNVKKITTKYNNYKYYIGVVKANAYGHGAYVVNALIDGGVNYLAISSLDEAVEVRKYNKDIPILCLEPINTKYINDCIKYKVTITIDSILYFRELMNEDFKGKLKVHLKLDTGMNRLGIKSQKEVMEIVSKLETSNSIILEGIYTHMATTGINDSHFDAQVNKFKSLIKDIDLSKIDIIHIGKSSTLVQHKKLDFVTGIRMGIIMYGFNCSIPMRKGFKGFIYELRRNKNIKKYNISPTFRSNDLKLKTAFSLYTEVMSLRRVRAGETVGYGAEYKVPNDTLIATLPIGSADGINQNYKYVSINGRKYSIVGEVCMDMITVSVDNNVKLHDKVEIFGDTISVRETTRNLGSNAYRVFTSITTRVPRVYSDNTEIKY